MVGKLVQCPACGKALRVEALVPASQADPIFDRDRFLLHQKHLSVSQKYYVWDDQGNVLVFVERPVHFFRSLVAILAGFGAALALLVVVIGLAAGLARISEAAAGIIGVVGVVAVIFGMIVVIILLAPKRHVHFYRDDSRADQILQVLQDKKLMLLTATYTILDQSGAPLAKLRKNYLYNVLRKRWHCFANDGSLICLALEDSIILSMLRRLVGPMLGILRTNFVIVTPDQQHIIGEFNRKFTILDTRST